MDDQMMDMKNLSIAKICVEMDLNEGLPKGIGFKYGDIMYSQLSDSINIPSSYWHCREVEHLKYN